MGRWWAALAGVVLAAGLSRAEAEAKRAPVLEAAVLPPEASVGRRELPEGGAVIRLRAARGERQPALVVLRSSADARLRAQATALYGPLGAEIPAEAVELDQVEYVPCLRGEVADRLEPWRGEVSVAARENALAWVEVAVPADAAPGFYHGAVLVSGAGAQRELPLELEVLPFALPATPSLATSFGLPPSLRGEVARVAMRERITVRVVSPPPFRVQPGEGTLDLDFTQFDADLALLAGANPQPSSVEVTVPRSVPAPRRVAYLMAVKRHLTERGLGGLLVNFTREGSLLDHLTGAPTVPGFSLVSAEGAGGHHGRFWWRLGSAPGRTALAPPVRQADWLSVGTPGYQVRSIGWAAFRAGAAGLYDPRYLALLYAAPDGTVRESVRLKLLRKGLEDYEYLTRAEARSPEEVRALVYRALPGPEPLAQHPFDFEANREQLWSLVAPHRTLRRARAR